MKRQAAATVVVDRWRYLLCCVACSVLVWCVVLSVLSESCLALKNHQHLEERRRKKKGELVVIDRQTNGGRGAAAVVIGWFLIIIPIAFSLPIYILM